MAILAAKNTPTARALAQRMGVRRINPLKTPLPARGVIINWGSHQIPVRGNRAILNKPESVQVCADKVRTFSVLDQAAIPCVPHTSDLEEALAWHNHNKTIYARTLTRGHGGRGIVLIRPDDQFNPDDFRGVRLFTRFVKCEYESRVHVAGGRVIDYAVKKRRRVEERPANRYWIRNYANGWVFTRRGVELRDGELDTAVAGVRALGLDFAAVDVRVDEHGHPHILELNSTPRLTGTTLERYADYFNLFREEP